MACLIFDALLALDRAADFCHCDLNTFLQLIDTLCNHRLAFRAYNICFKDPSFFVNRDTKVHKIHFQGWLKIGWWGQCRRFWEEMNSRMIDMDLHSYFIYMGFVSKSGKPWKAIKLYKEIRNKGISADVVAHNTVIQAAGLCYGAERAISEYREMLDSGCKPNGVTLNIIIKLLCIEGKMMKGCEANVMAYHCLFKHSNKPQEIMCLFEKMVPAGCRPQMDTYVMLMKKVGRWRFSRPVFMISKAMEEDGRVGKEI